MNRAGIVILVILLSGTHMASAQERKEIGLKAANLRARQIDGRTVFDLTRPVLTQKDSVLRSDFGMDEGNGFVRFWGNVEIMEVEDTLRADRVRYNQDTKIGIAEGNVFLTDGVAKIRAPNATHFSEQDRTEFEDGVSYTDSLGVLLAERAVYLSDINQALFSGEVQFSQDEVNVHADSVSYSRDEEISEAWGRVLIEQVTDSTSTHIIADYLFRDVKKDSMQVSGSTRLAKIDFAQSDTAYVFAQKMSLLGQDGKNSVTAVDSVVVSTKSYALRGDSLITLSLRDGKRISRIFGNPLAWLERTQISADSLFYSSDSGTETRDSTVTIANPDSLFGYGSVFVASQDSSSERIQQLSGRRLMAVLRDDSLRTLILEENAEALFYTRESPDDPLSAISASGDGVVFKFEDGEPVYVGFYEDVKALLYAENLFDQLSNLSGFTWTPELMPDRAVLSWEFWFEAQSRNRTANH
jgi:lipopolysaccharide export system protein LptA